MAFKDSDIKSHLRDLGLESPATTNYDKLDEQGRRDPKTGEGIEGHKAKFRREREEKFSLSNVGDKAQNSLGRLRWSK